MKLFNAFQFVALFMALPYLIVWLRSASFIGASVASVTAFICYLIQAGIMVALTYDWAGKN